MHRRFMAVALAASSLMVVALAAPEVAQSKPLRGQKAESQSTRFLKSTKVRTRRAAQAQSSNPYADDRFNYGPVTAAPERKTKRRDRRRSAARPEVVRTSSGQQDDRFNFGPQTAKARSSARRGGRDAMARAYTPDSRRDVSDHDGPSFTRTSSFGFGSTSVVSEARRYIGTNPTGRRSLWCARFMNLVLERSGYRGTGSDMASSFARYGQRVSGPQIGAIAVMSRGRRGGHVGVVSGIDEKGNPVIISGNHGNRVAEAAYPRGRVYAYVLPH